MAVVVGTGSASAIANGTLASAGQDPFAVKLAMTHIARPDGTFYDSACSAALISPTWIITAGHCFHDVNRTPVSGPVPYATSATLNTVDLTKSPGEVRNVTYVRQSSSNDIALAKLSAPVTDVRPLGLSTTAPRKGALLTVAGWGATSSVNPTPSTRLFTGVVKASAVRSTTLDVVGYFPAPDTSACLYDSGAPYFTPRPGVSRCWSRRKATDRTAPTPPRKPPPASTSTPAGSKPSSTTSPDPLRRRAAGCAPTHPTLYRRRRTAAG